MLYNNNNGIPSVFPPSEVWGGQSVRRPNLPLPLIGRKVCFRKTLGSNKPNQSGNENMTTNRKAGSSIHARNHNINNKVRSPKHNKQQIITNNKSQKQQQ